MSFVELEEKMDSLSYEFKVTIWNMVDYFVEKQKERDKNIFLEDGKKAFEALRHDADETPEMSLDEINAEILEMRQEKKAVVL